MNNDKGNNPQRPMTAAEERTAKLSLQEISAVFHLPLHEACVHLQADEPALKKRYRELGITAWPYRKRYKFDNPTIDSMVRAAGSNKITHEQPSPKSPFGNFIVTNTKKKAPGKKEEEYAPNEPTDIRESTRHMRDRLSPPEQRPSYHPYHQTYTRPHAHTHPRSHDYYQQTSRSYPPQYYGAPQQQSYGSPPQQRYGPPISIPAPQQQQVYDSPQQHYGSPPQYAPHSTTHSHQSYRNPPIQQHYGSPPQYAPQPHVPQQYAPSQPSTHAPPLTQYGSPPIHTTPQYAPPPPTHIPPSTRSYAPPPTMHQQQPTHYAQHIPASRPQLTTVPPPTQYSPSHNVVQSKTPSPPLESSKQPSPMYLPPIHELFNAPPPTPSFLQRSTIQEEEQEQQEQENYDTQRGNVRYSQTMGSKRDPS